MTIQLFSSGSVGNATLIKTKNNNILIDIGISKKAILEGLENNNLTLDNINAILLTHAHDDHIRSLGSILRASLATIYMTLGTYNDLMQIKDEKLKDLIKFKKETGQIEFLAVPQDSLFYYPININSDTITAIPTFHDATESVGYIIKSEDKKLVYITDTGYIHSALFEIIADANAYIIESNYDPYTLMNSTRPQYNKMRTLSDHGHLSNEDSCVVLAKVMGLNTNLIIHAHISQECNLSQVIIDTREKVFDDYGINTSNIEFVISSPRPTKVYEI